jgi:hypothetical protein
MACHKRLHLLRQTTKGFGLKMALANSNADIIVKTDCTSVLEASRDGRYDRSQVSLIAKDFFPLAETSGLTNYCLYSE